MQIALLADAHLFYQGRKFPAYELVVGKFLTEAKPDKVFLLGDFMDFSYISKFSNGKWGLKEGVRLGKDFAYGRDEIARMQDATKAEVVYFEGNHEWRVEALIEGDPVLEDLISFDKQMQFEALGVKWIPRLRQPFKVGGMSYLHGEIVTKYHVRRTLETYYTSVCYGHVHRPQMETLAMPGQGKVLHGYSLGCLCPLNPDYLKGKPSAWSLGFGWADVSGKNTTITQVPIENGGFVFDRRRWSWQK